MPRIGFVLEQTLGHITHSDNLQRLLGHRPEVDATFMPIESSTGRIAGRIPAWSNWTIRAGLRARRVVRRMQRSRPVDALFVHTQVPAILLGKWMRRVPTVVSLDATPIQYDQLGEFYQHDVSSARVEAWKKAANERCFRLARHLVTWSAWTRDALVRDYGVPAAKVTVIAPGVDLALWETDRRRPEPAGGVVRILFVGGDLARKGGDLLLQEFRSLRDDPSAPDLELHLVTRSEVPVEPGVHAHRLAPNSPELVALYHSCDVFCLPTLGDCLPMVLSEAGAAGMALISTSVGAIHEIVRDGETGLLIPPHDRPALGQALRRLVSDEPLRRKLGAGAQQLVRRDYDAAKNASLLVEIMSDLAR